MITDLLNEMLWTYYQLNFKAPSKIIMNMSTVRRQFESDLRIILAGYREYERTCSYHGIDITFDTDETFISLQK